MKKVIRKFKSITKCEYSETISTFSTVIKLSYSRCFVLNVESQKFENGILISDNSANIYFDTYEELINEMEYHFNLCKENLYTEIIIQI